MDVMLEDSEKDWDVDPDDEQQKKKKYQQWVAVRLPIAMQLRDFFLKA